MDTEYGIDWESPHGYHHEGVTVPEVQLPRLLTEAEMQRLPNPHGSFSNVLNRYSETVVMLTDIFADI